MESVDGPAISGGGLENAMESTPVGLPFMHNLSVPLGLIFRNSNAGGGLVQSKCNGFMSEADYEKATSGTKQEIKRKTKRTKISMKNTRRKLTNR